MAANRVGMGRFDDSNFQDMVDPREVVELSLHGDTYHDPFTVITSEFTSLTELSLCDRGLTSLEGCLPRLESLQVLNLECNKLSGGLEELSSICPNLTSLNINSNEFDNINELAPLQELKELRELQVCNNYLCDEPYFKDILRDMLKTVDFHYDDGETVLLSEREEEEDGSLENGVSSDSNGEENTSLN